MNQPTNDMPSQVPSVSSCQDIRCSLQATMGFLAAIACGIEEAVGNTSTEVAYLAGEKLGTRLAENAERTTDVSKALEEVRRILKENQCLWRFEIFQPAQSNERASAGENGQEVRLVFRDCMIRQSLFLFGHQQKGSLCNMMNGFFSSALQHIMGSSSRLEILHAGQNACYKVLRIAHGGETEEKAGPSSRIHS